MTRHQFLRRKILARDYYLSAHAEEEMVDDDFQRADVEAAILNGTIVKRYTQDARGIRYRILGPALDGRLANVVCRIRTDKTMIIITVFAQA